jgi:hypothetical protein
LDRVGNIAALTARAEKRGFGSYADTCRRSLSILDATTKGAG